LKIVEIGKKLIGDRYPTFILAEMAWSHDGSPENAKRIIDGAADAGADAVCFHLTSMEDYMVPHYRTGKGRVSAGKETIPIYEYLSRINLSPKDWAQLFPYAKRRGLLVCAMCNDFPSLRLATALGTDSYVISPASLVEEEFIRETAGKSKPIFLRIGGATLEEIERAIAWIKEEGNEDIVLIYGFQSYPTDIKEMHLRFIPTLKQRFRFPVGFADHTDGGSDLALVIPIIAMAFGANVIEKHLTYDRSARGEDFESALDPPVFKKFVSWVRGAELSFGSSEIRPLSKAELEYREIARKRVVAARDIGEGEKITKEMVAFKRSDEGIFPDEVKKVIGKVTIARIRKNEPITLDKFREESE
jgi:sialic acid synthase SpsE